MDIAEDRWLAERFGHPVFTLREAGPGFDAEALRAHRDGRGAATYQAKVPAAEVESIRMLGAEGFYVTNAGITLGRTPPDSPSAELPPRHEVRDADPERDTALLDVAGRCFTASRFHLDPAIPDAVANRVKRDWVESYFRGTRGEKLLVAAEEGRQVGFLAVMAGESGGRRVRTIDLIGVDPDHQYLGAGRALVGRFLDESVGACDLVQVGTQAANEPATRFYQRMGFLVANTFFDLHLHVGGAFGEG